IGDAGGDEYDENRDGTAVERECVNTALVAFRQQMCCLAGESRLVAIHDHGGALASLPAGRFEDKERFDPHADFVRPPVDFVFELAECLQSALKPAKFSEVMGSKTPSQIAVAIELALQIGPFCFAGNQQRKVSRLRDHAQSGGKGAVGPRL